MSTTKLSTAVFIALLFLVSALPSQSATLTVMNLNDSGPDSLRQLITDAMSGDDIVFDNSIAGGTINFNSVIIISDKDLTITGPGDNPITFDGNNMTRLFSVSGTFMMTRTVTFANLIFENGLVSGTMNESGGAIGATGFPFADIVIQDCSFRNNRVECEGTSCQARGGAVIVSGQLTIIRSTFEGNSTHCSVNNQQCFASGGAVEHGSISSVAIFNSTFNNNLVSCLGTGDSTCTLEGGALFIDNVGGTLNNNTFSNNGLLCDASTCNIFGSNIYVDDSSTDPEMSNTIIHNPVLISSPNCDGNIVDAGNNIQFPGNSCGGTIPTEDADPDPLADNGGITETMAISQSSPAFNGGDNITCEGIDQRGITRPQEGTCDIGAYELVIEEEPEPTPTPSAPIVIVPTMGQWGMIFMVIAFAAVSIITARTRQSSVQ